MNCSREIISGVYWIGASDRRIELFENIFPVPEGMAYNAYLIEDEKTAIIDTVDSSVTRLYLENIKGIIGETAPDYLVVNHMEPDHCAGIEDLCQLYPQMKIVGNAKTFQYMSQFYSRNLSERFYEVKDGDTLNLGTHTLKFIFAPMVHWPEVMVTYVEDLHLLFSADAFGSFGALSGNLFADEMDINDFFWAEARRYYANIVGKYGVQVQSVLKKVLEVSVEMICPLHGPIWRRDFDTFINKYNLWSQYLPEKKGVLIAYGSIYGNTQAAAHILANQLAEKGIRDIRMLDASKTHMSYLISDIFKYSHLVLASPTYNSGIFPPMLNLIHDMAALGIRNRKVVLISNGTWAPTAHTAMQKMLAEMKEMEVITDPLLLKSAIKPEQMADVQRIAEKICDSLNR